MATEDRQGLVLVRPVFEKFFDLRPVDFDVLVSPPRHFGGFFKGTRLFGGHTAAQSYVAAKRFRKDRLPYRIDVNFLAPGNLTHDLIYVDQTGSQSTDFLTIDVHQNGNLIANTAFRFYPEGSILNDSIVSPTHNNFPANILDPLEYPEILTTKLDRFGWHKKFGRSFNYNGCSNENHIFHLRPVDLHHYGGISTEAKPIALWARLSPALLDLEIPDPEVVPLLLTDFIVGHPIFVRFDQQQIRVASSASLTHKCVFVRHDFDPRGFFFIELDMEQANGTSLIKGRVFDEQRRLVIRFLQNHYYTLNRDDLGAKL